jgi:hypothetical protein
MNLTVWRVEDVTIDESVATGGTKEIEGKSLVSI